MRIATVTTFFPHSADRHRAVFVENLVRAMQRQCPVEVISPVPFAPPLRRIPDWYAQSQLPHREDIDGIDVTHPRFVVLPKLEGVTGATFAAGILPTLIRLRRDSSDVVVHAHCAYPDGVGAALACRLVGLPYVVTAHGSDINVYARRLLLRRQIRWALRGAAAIISVSRDLQAKVSHLLQADRMRIPLLHIPCAGFDPTQFHPRERSKQRVELGLEPGGKLAVFVGQLVPVKGVNHLLEAWGLLFARGQLGKRDRLVVIGEGKCGVDLARQTVRQGIGDSVVFAGVLGQSTVARWIAAADLLCLPSHNEGTPNVVVEALASGVPVVASRVGGIPELVTQDGNGLLVPAGDSNALARAVAAALSRAWDTEQIRRSVVHLTWDAIAAQNVKCLSSIAGGDRVVVD